MITPATLTLTPDGTPYSETYGDVYHTAAGGLGQARHVFLAGNGLPARWQGRERFVVVETGFGLGLNFLATWAAWKDDPARCGRLHFISVEKHPFRAEDLAALHRAWPELAPLTTQLREQWPTLVPALHRLHFDGGQVVLDLVFGDAADCVPQLHARADAFYLDGFSPAKNPELWQADLLGALSALAAPGATLATWSVAGGVREALATHGWQLEKAPGFSGKREMLRGTFPGRHDHADTPAAGHRHAIVLGAGLAGSTAANRLAARGWQVTVVDAKGGPGEGASGNRAGVLRPLPSRDDNRLAQITRAGFLAARRHVQALAAADVWRGPIDLWGPVGVLHLARDAVHENTQRAIVEAQQPPADYLRFVDRDEAAALCGWPVDAGGWWFPDGGWVSPAGFCNANLLQFAERITRRFSTQVDRIERVGELWRVFAGDGNCIAEAPHLVLANASDARRLLGDWLAVFPARGQVSHLPAAAGSPPHCVVCRLGYVTPEVGGLRCAGATFLMQDPDPALREADHAENLAKLDFILPGYAQAFAPEALDGRVGFRPASPDRLPMVGAVARLGESPAPPGLWLVDGFGARGIVWSAMAGELLADSMEDSPRVLGRDLAAALAPSRFVDRPQRRRAARPDRGE
jgi:tRNA 5-methylaminomethyl-2-thiouridine biosynthesis bifunctional protein